MPTISLVILTISAEGARKKCKQAGGELMWFKDRHESNIFRAHAYYSLWQEYFQYVPGVPIVFLGVNDTEVSTILYTLPAVDVVLKHYVAVIVFIVAVFDHCSTSRLVSTVLFGWENKKNKISTWLIYLLNG